MIDDIITTKVTRQIRSVYGTRTIAITAFALEGDRDKCLKAGMYDYIGKPAGLSQRGSRTL